MELIVDFHIHSRYARATSPNMNLEELYYWGKLKGINIIGTGDFTHPTWYNDLAVKLEEAEPGLFRLKEQYVQAKDKILPQTLKNNILRFVLTVEICCIYTKYGRVRKSHNIIIAPDLKTVQAINTQLAKIGNLHSDGRPILGMDSKDLLDLCLKINPDILFVPAHIWTPWFSVFGAKSGFDSLDEAFEELTPHILAVETGLSSDPAMNWRISDLQHLTLLSNSDAHSAQKLGREANIFDCDLSYFELLAAIKTRDQRFCGTIEFYPQEGRYFNSGHRNCGISLNSQQTKELNGICPRCAKPLTLGVNYRVNQLAAKTAEYLLSLSNRKRVEYIIPLIEILSMVYSKGINSKFIQSQYFTTLNALGTELAILRGLEQQALRAHNPALAQALENMHSVKILLEPGYDGVDGRIKI